MTKSGRRPVDVRAPIVRLIVAGDLVESHRPCARTDHDLRRLRASLAERGVTLVALEGNHDRAGLPALRGGAPEAEAPPVTGSFRLPTSIVVDGWTIAHGHQPIAGPRTSSGHFHPVLRAEGFAAPCFLVSANRIVLPAFSANAAGCDVRTARIPADWLDPTVRCIASSGAELLDFGPLRAIRNRRVG